MNWLAEIARRNRVLYATGLFQLAVGLLFLLGLTLDPRQLLGLNAWTKPLKFALSITLFTWTIAWLSAYLKDKSRAVSNVSWIISISMIVEILCVGLQSLRGVSSHFNEATALDGFIFTTMGLFILINTVAVFRLLFVFLTTTLDLPPPYALALRIGLLIFIVGSIEGAAMVANRAHTIGLPDGGPGLPLLNWSTRGGDLRVSHFLGLHAIQMLPLFGWLVRRQKNGTKMVALFGTLTLLLMVGLFVQALLGRPLIAY